MSRSLLHDWECAIDKCCREDNPIGMISIAEDIYNTAYIRGQNHSIELEEVLGKIRAEIKELDGRYIIGDNEIYGENNPKYVRLLDVFAILDKYKAESEVDNGNDD